MTTAPQLVDDVDPDLDPDLNPDVELAVVPDLPAVSDRWTVRPPRPQAEGSWRTR